MTVETTPEINLVTIFHNVSTDYMGRPVGFLDGYVKGHALLPVYQYVHEATEVPYADREVTEDAFHAFNVGEQDSPPDVRALAYRAARNRSLSVGDVVRIEGQGRDHWLACASVGWDDISAPAFLARNSSVPGSNPIPRGVELNPHVIMPCASCESRNA